MYKFNRHSHLGYPVAACKLPPAALLFFRLSRRLMSFLISLAYHLPSPCAVCSPSTRVNRWILSDPIESYAVRPNRSYKIIYHFCFMANYTVQPAIQSIREPAGSRNDQEGFEVMRVSECLKFEAEKSNRKIATDGI
ncbi:hypothetical protein C8R42DRAFT_668180 [Lentinula raphanica]|nr:hypothetical protein C8R42DRAFT_668180 [Lentinula raphanica]